MSTWFEEFADMRLVFTSYVKSPAYHEPGPWLKRIEAYTGILESLARDHTVIGIERINYAGECGQNGVRYCFIKLKRNVVYFPFRIHRLIKRLEPDIVFVNGFIFPLQIIQLKLKMGRKTRIIVLHRAEKPFKGIKRFLQVLADKCVDAYLFSSLSFQDEWQRNIDPGKMHQVMQASSVFHQMEKGQAKQAAKLTAGPIFLWVGRLDANKDPLTVIGAFLQFLEKQPQAQLHMIYQSDDLLLQVKAAINSSEKGASQIHLVGKVDHRQMEAWYNGADFIISGSHYEGGGTAVIEAMSCGCIPVVTDIPSFRGITGKGKCGLLYEPGNKEELSNVLFQTATLDMETERRKVLQQFSGELSFDAIAGKINKIINSFDKKI